MSFFQTRGRAILTSALLVLGAIGVGLGARTAYDAMNGSCCAPGAPCCFPGSPCCAHGRSGDVADAR